MVLFISYVFLTFESVDKILWCYHSNERSLTVLSHGTIYLHVVRYVVLTFKLLEKILGCYHSSETSLAPLQNICITFIIMYYFLGLNKKIFTNRIFVDFFSLACPKALSDF